MEARGEPVCQASFKSRQYERIEKEVHVIEEGPSVEQHSSKERGLVVSRIIGKLEVSDCARKKEWRDRKDDNKDKRPKIPELIVEETAGEGTHYDTNHKANL